jgi:hypothetical protein
MLKTPSVPPGTVHVALAAPLATVPLVTEHNVVLFCVTANEKVPPFTAPATLLTVAVKLTFCELAL